jgi:phage baseplate assembly protein W
MALYNGFSTYNRSKHFRITDFELVKQDLINHFNIRKGEKLMNPDYGTVIWDTLFDPLDDDTKNIIVQDVKRIIGSDPRVGAQNVIVTQFEHGIQIEIDLIYISTNQRNLLSLTFDRNSRTVALFKHPYFFLINI